MIGIKFIYDSKTQETLEYFDKVLKEYEKLLIKELETVGIHEAEKSYAFITNESRAKIVSQRARICALAIPTSIEITEVVE